MKETGQWTCGRVDIFFLESVFLVFKLFFLSSFTNISLSIAPITVLSFRVAHATFTTQGLVSISRTTHLHYQ